MPGKLEARVHEGGESAANFLLWSKILGEDF